MKSQTNKDIFSESGCQSRESLLSYIDGRLGANEKHEVEKHLVDCHLCSEALDGLKMLSKSHTMEDVNSSINTMIKVGSSFSPSKYYLAAASLAAVMILSYVAYKQFNDVKEERLAVHEVIAPENISVDKNESAVTTESLQPTPEPYEQQSAVAGIEKINKVNQSVDVSLDKAVESISGIEINEEILTETEMVDQNLTFQQDYESQAQATSTGATFKSSPLSNNITYIDNLKVIEYPDPVLNEVKDKISSKHTPSAYQNREKKMEAAKAEQDQGVSSIRNTNYQELVTDPLILYNKGRYESAIQGFDQMLEINPNDYNAIFYKAMSLYHLKNFNRAISLFKKIGDDAQNPFSEEALFYMAKSYAGTGDTFNAVSNFNRVVYSNGFYSGKANDELDKLK